MLSQIDSWNTIVLKFDSVRVSRACVQQFLKTMLKVIPEPLQVHRHVRRRVTIQLLPRGNIHLAGTAQVSVSKMEECNRCLNQSMNELPFLALNLGPEFFQLIVAVEKLAFVKKPDSFEIQLGQFIHPCRLSFRPEGALRRASCDLSSARHLLSERSSLTHL